MRPLLLDLFCKAGGAGMGYHRAGFDVIGVDIEPQKNYPFPFIQADAIAVLTDVAKLDRVGTWSSTVGRRLASLGIDRMPDAVHASPPCQDHSVYKGRHGADRGTGVLLGQTRELLKKAGIPWVIENVAGADMRADYALCGCMFVETPMLRRVRWFETSWGAGPELPHHHVDGERVITVTGHTGGTSKRDGSIGRGTTAEWRQAMGISWMSGRELAQAIPPAYTAYVGAALMTQVKK